MLFRSVDPLEEGMTATLVLLPGESHRQRSLVGYSPWGRKESDTTERLHFYSMNTPLVVYPFFYQWTFEFSALGLL